MGDRQWPDLRGWEALTQQEAEQDARKRDPFADDVLGRLIASNQDYQRSHGHYIVPLSERLLSARAALAVAERERDQAREALR